MAADIRDVFPGSEPKDSSSPFRGITKGWDIGGVLQEGLGRSLRGSDFAGLFRGNMAPVAAGAAAAMGAGAGSVNGGMTVTIRDPDRAIASGGYNQGQIESVLSYALREMVGGAKHRSLRMGT